MSDWSLSRFNIRLIIREQSTTGNWYRGIDFVSTIGRSRCRFETLSHRTRMWNESLLKTENWRDWWGDDRWNLGKFIWRRKWKLEWNYRMIISPPSRGTKITRIWWKYDTLCLEIMLNQRKWILERNHLFFIEWYYPLTQETNSNNSELVEIWFDRNDGSSICLNYARSTKTNPRTISFISHRCKYSFRTNGIDGNIIEHR